MALSPPFYVCDDARCRHIARDGRLDRYKILFNEFDEDTAYDSLLDETSAALYEMNHKQLVNEARRAAPFICSHETPTLQPYRAKLLLVFHEHGCLKFLHVVPQKPRNVFNPRFWLSISDEAGHVVDVGFDSMLSYAETFGIPRRQLYRYDFKSRTGKHSRKFFTTVDMKNTEDPLTTPEGKALLKQVQNDPLTKDAAPFVQENSVRFYLAGLLDDNPKKPLTNSQKRAEKRLLQRRQQSFSGVTPSSDARDPETPIDAGDSAPLIDLTDVDDHTGQGPEEREAVRSE